MGEDNLGREEENPLELIAGPIMRSRSSEKDLEFLSMFPPGYRFCPKDEELITYYLKPKVYDQPLPWNTIVNIDIYKYNPEDLAVAYSKHGEKEWYFFTPRDKKYLNGTRPNRATIGGYWKATGADKPIKRKNVIIGYRKALVFYRGKPPRSYKTNWIMHEFRVSDPPPPRSATTTTRDSAADKSYKNMRLDDSVLCRIYKKSDKPVRNKNHNKGEEEGEADMQFVNEINKNDAANIMGMRTDFSVDTPPAEFGILQFEDYNYPVEDKFMDSGAIHNQLSSHLGVADQLPLASFGVDSFGSSSAPGCVGNYYFDGNGGMRIPPFQMYDTNYLRETSFNLEVHLDDWYRNLDSSHHNLDNSSANSPSKNYSSPSLPPQVNPQQLFDDCQSPQNDRRSIKNQQKKRDQNQQ